MKWNRHNAHSLATTYGGEVKLWDARNPKMPTHFITAHASRILSIDWSTQHPQSFVTSGQDCSIRFFDLNEDVKKPRKMLKTAVPVWKAR